MEEIESVKMDILPDRAKGPAQQKYLPYNKGFLWMLTIVGSIGGFLFGYDTGIISGAQLYLKDTWPEITTIERELVVSLALLGAFVGALIAGPLSDAFGRKPVIIASDVLFAVGSLVMTFADEIYILMIGRIIVGLGVGVASMIVPLYLSECCPVQTRGAVVSTFVVSITVGQLISSIIALVCGRNWRLMLGIGVIPAVIQLVWMLFLPESQRFLAKKKRFNATKETLQRVYVGEAASIELRNLEQEVEEMWPYIQQTECERYGELFTVYKKCLFIGCALQFFQQFVGINTIMYYGPEIIIESGTTVDGIDDKEQLGILLNIPLAATNAIGSLIAVFIIDNLGRRYIIIRTLPGVFSSLVAVALAMYISINGDNQETKNKGHILFGVAIVSYLLFFSIGFSTTPWTINQEIYPIHLIGTATALATATNWLSNFIVSSLFLTSMETDAGKVYTFLILAGFSALALIFVLALVPETANRTIQTNIKKIIGELPSEKDQKYRKIENKE